MERRSRNLESPDLFVSFSFERYIWITECDFVSSGERSFCFYDCVSCASLLLFMCGANYWLLTVSFICFLYFTNVIQLLCSLGWWLHLKCSSTGTGFNGAKTNCIIAQLQVSCWWSVTVFLYSFSSICSHRHQCFFSRCWPQCENILSGFPKISYLNNLMVAFFVSPSV